MEGKIAYMCNLIYSHSMCFSSWHKVISFCLVIHTFINIRWESTDPSNTLDRYPPSHLPSWLALILYNAMTITKRYPVMTFSRSRHQDSYHWYIYPVYDSATPFAYHGCLSINYHPYAPKNEHTWITQSPLTCVDIVHIGHGGAWITLHRAQQSLWYGGPRLPFQLGVWLANAEIPACHNSLARTRSSDVTGCQGKPSTAKANEPTASRTISASIARFSFKCR